MKKNYTTFFHLLVFLAMSTQLTAQNNINGTWGGLINADMIPVGAANLPDGRIVAWSAYDRFNFGADNGQTYTSLYDPSNNSFTTTLIANTGHDMFCPGTANLATGEIMITGGSSSNKTTIYNPANGTFSTGPEMNTGRGYHSTVTLNDGRVFAIGGSWSGGQFNKNAEIWSPMGGWNNLANVTSNNTIRQGAPDIQGIFRDDNHAWIFAGTEGKVFQLGPGTNMHLIETNGQGAVIDLGNRGNDAYSMNGNAVMYDKGKVLTSGGAQRYGTDPGQTGSLPASNRAYTIDINSNTPTVIQVGNMNKARTLHNSVVLPNGEVLAIGGLPTSRLFSDLDAHLAAEIWNPNTGNWRQVVDMVNPRTYHSVAILMKDGRVWSAGGGLCGGCDVNHPDAQIYTPPYLYNSSGGLASRPVINTAPDAANYNSNITVNTNQAINNFVLMRLSSVTHSVNVEQRRIPVTFQAIGGNNYNVIIPNRDWLPPGNYYLFALNGAGVPSVAKTIKIGGIVVTTNQLIANGAYYIESSPTGQYMAAPSFDNNNVRMVDNSNTADQKWDIVHLGDNVYTLQNQGNNRYLEAFAGGCGNGTNVFSAADADDNSKRWIASKVGDDFLFQPVNCSSHGIDNGNGTNKSVLLWDFSSGNNNQRFRVKPAGATPTNNQLIANGAYYIESSPTGQHMAAPSFDNNNVRMVDNSNTADQKWNIVHLGDNVYTLQNQGNNRYLASLNVTCNNGINVFSSSTANNDSKRWKASKVGDNFMFQTVKCPSHGIDNGNGNNKSVLLWSFSTGNANQHFKVKPATGGGTTDGFLQVNGSYNIKSRTNNQHVIAPGSIDFNVQMADAGTATEVWLVEHLGDGIHTIKNTSTDRFLEVESGQCFNNANTKTWVSANSDHQKWKIFKEGTNFYFLPSHCLSHALDTRGGFNNLTLMWAYNKNNDNQKFELVPVNGSTDVRATAIDARSLNATPLFGQKTALEWYHVTNSSDKVSAYTFQHYDENMEEFIDLERVTTTSDEEIAIFDYIHDKPVIGENYYQVKIEFLDGSIDFSNIRVVSFEPKPATIILAPNPAQDYIKLDLTNYPDEKIYYFISSLQGEVLVNGQFDKNHLDVETINLKSIPNGNYIMYTRPENHREITQQFVIMKNH